MKFAFLKINKYREDVDRGDDIQQAVDNLSLSVSVSCLDDAASCLARDGQMTRVITLILSTLSGPLLPGPTIGPIVTRWSLRVSPVPTLCRTNAPHPSPSRRLLETEKCVLWAD